jgi:LysR family hca operon transcriptional activator
MDIRVLRYFVAVAEEMNITRASEILHTSQPSLSQQIQQLEKEFNATLFHREKHRLRFTEAGRTLLPLAKSIIASVDHAMAQVKAAAEGEKWTISLGMVPGPEGKIFSYLLPLLLRQCPNVHLSLKSMTAPEQIKALLRRDIAAGFLRGPIESSEIASEIYMREDVVVVLPQDCELARLDRVPVAELAKKMTLVPVSADVAPAIYSVATDIEKREGVEFKRSYCTENLMMALNAVGSGLGFTFFSAYVSEVVPQGVVTRPLDLDPVPHLDLLFAYRSDSCLPALGELISLVREYSPFHLGKCAKGGAKGASLAR